MRIIIVIIPIIGKETAAKWAGNGQVLRDEDEFLIHKLPFHTSCLFYYMIVIKNRSFKLFLGFLCLKKKNHRKDLKISENLHECVLVSHLGLTS